MLGICEEGLKHLHLMHLTSAALLYWAFGYHDLDGAICPLVAAQLTIQGRTPVV